MRRSFDYLLILGLAVCLACGDALDVQAPDYAQKVVIDGFIENGKYPLVYLTLSSGYYDQVDSLELLKLILATAKVEVSDGEQSEILTLFRNTKVYPPFYYAGTDLRGEIGKVYSITVTSKGEVYQAQTKILDPVSIDSLWYEPSDVADSLVYLKMAFTDPNPEQDYFRVFTRVVSAGEDFIPTYQSVFSDRLFNGGQFDFTVLKGSESFTDIENDYYFNKGDTVTVKLCVIDAGIFEFWRSLEQELYLTGNPFGSSGNQIKTNITGTKPALGAWCGYGITTKTIIMK